MKHNKTFFININYSNVRTETQKSTDSQNKILNKRSDTGGITIPDLKIHYRVIIKAMCYWNEKRHIDHGTKTEDPNPRIPKYNSLTVAKNINWRKDRSSTNGAGKTGYPYAEE